MRTAEVKKKTVVKAIFLSGILLAVILGLLYFHLNQNTKQEKIGLIMWEADTPLFLSVDQYVEWLSEMLDIPIQVMYCRGEGYTDYEKMINDFAKNGGKAIINVNTEDLVRISRSCKENKVGLIQMWELPEDTDWLEQVRENPYYIGSFVSDEQKACNAIAQELKESGCKEITVLSKRMSSANCNINRLRQTLFLDALKPLKPVYTLECQELSEGVRYTIERNIDTDGLVLSNGELEFSLQEIAQKLNRPKLKVAYFDINDHSRQELESGNLAIVCGGQQNVLVLAVSCAWAYLKRENSWPEQIEVTCPYLEVKTPEDYDIYEEKCVSRLPYSKTQIKELTDHLIRERSTEILQEYADSYTVEWLNSQK